MAAVWDILKAAVNNPDIRQFAGRLIASGARDCDAPGCDAKSPPGAVCAKCGRFMCLAHLTCRMEALTTPMCSVCIGELWGIEASETGAEFKTRSRPTGIPGKRKRAAR